MRARHPDQRCQGETHHTNLQHSTYHHSTTHHSPLTTPPILIHHSTTAPPPPKQKNVSHTRYEACTYIRLSQWVCRATEFADQLKPALHGRKTVVRERAKSPAGRRGYLLYILAGLFSSFFLLLVFSSAQCPRACRLSFLFYSCSCFGVLHPWSLV
ncbi:hypothetical protein ASPCADRAFT_134167 [Aspergillus carbonarius ITEM 5010]|uniref:Uncharacterized protein n=1 Tax=Aspergillus carbonarius (strain ITEM 5010) TaxID=602072 RepID=A0A1R3RAY1_ASPC5|nr:hypothetical protein ASPCADRAFT_134167 [Aspergillus carbonarius ITEM 5010]